MAINYINIVVIVPTSLRKEFEFALKDSSARILSNRTDGSLEHFTVACTTVNLEQWVRGIAAGICSVYLLSTLIPA